MEQSGAVGRAVKSGRSASPCFVSSGVMDVQTAPLKPEQIEAVRATLVGWGNELDDGNKVWWAHWSRLIDDVITAVRTGAPVDYDDE